MRNRLGMRLASLIVLTGPLMFFVFMNIVYFTNRLFGESQLQNAVWVAIAIITIPVAMGMVAAWYVNRRLREFVQSIFQLRSGNYGSKIRPSGIREFDEIAREFNQLTKRLAKEEKLRKNLISDTSHELNTPLAAMHSQLTAMQEQVLDITPGRLQTFREQTERLIDMVNRLDDYTAARLPIKNLEPVSLYEVGYAVQDQLAALLNSTHMRLLITIEEEYKVIADKRALEQILLNIIRNAVKYSQGSQITIAKAEDGFAVSDNGKGVPTRDREHLFERFYRVEKSRNRATGGLGLGLAIVQELASQQGWRVRAEDARPGLRIRFTTH